MPASCILRGDHEQTAFFWIENNKFAASVLVPKYDSTDGSGIEGAEFKIEYWENGEGSTDGQYESFTSTTNSSGMLLLGSLKRGFYRITEVAAAPGYVMGKNRSRQHSRLKTVIMKSSLTSGIQMTAVPLTSPRTKASNLSMERASRTAA